MEITQVTCNGCGGTLEIGENARFVTCRYCGARLEVQRTASAVFTEVLDRIGKNTADMAADLGAIRREQEIERLDREWELERAGFMTRDKQGELHEPSESVSKIGSFVAGGFGILWTIFAIGLTSSAPSEGPFIVAKIIFPLFGILFTISAFAMGFKGAATAGQFERAKKEYQRRRAELVEGIKRAETNVEK